MFLFHIQYIGGKKITEVNVELLDGNRFFFSFKGDKNTNEVLVHVLRCRHYMGCKYQNCRCSVEGFIPPRFK